MGRVKQREFQENKLSNKVNNKKEFISDQTESDSGKNENVKKPGKLSNNSSDSSIDSEQLRYLKNKLKKAKLKK